jgi:hypothetical protein
MKHEAYNFELHTIRILKEKHITPDCLYPAWRHLPNSLIQIKEEYLNKPTKKLLNFLIERDMVMYRSILKMISDRKKRVSSLKFELLLTKYNLFLPPSLYKKHKQIELFRKQFIKTGRTQYITEIRKLDKEMSAEINKNHRGKEKMVITTISKEKFDKLTLEKNE